MSKYDSEKYQLLSYDFPNIIVNEKIHILPSLKFNHWVVEIFLTHVENVIVETHGESIKHYNQYGKRVYLDLCYGKVDYNPKFIWDGKIWLLQTIGNFLLTDKN